MFDFFGGDNRAGWRERCMARPSASLPDIDVTATVLTRGDSCASAGFVRDDLE